VDNLRQALKRGYGLVFLGNNGVGKTYFISYILMEAIRQNYSVYYTTLPQLDYNIKAGFDDYKLQKRLDLMLTSDFLAIDEMCKEKHKTTISTNVATFMDTHVERITKQRCDDSMPTLMATNVNFKTLLGTYGESVASIIEGKFRPVTMMPGDYRKKLALKMNKEMGY
jgi:DNA replication protein DnaC